MKSLLTAIFLLFITVTSIAQTIPEMRVDGQGEYLPSEIVSSNVKDANMEVCAGLIILTNLGGLQFNAMNGIVKVKSEPGKYFLYLSPGEKKVEVFKDGYMPLDIYVQDYDVDLESGSTWQLKVTGDPLPEAVSEVGVNFVVSPGDASVRVNGDLVDIANPVVLLPGDHTVRVSKDGFETVTESITVSTTNNLFRFTLEQVSVVKFTITSEPSGASITLENISEGATPVELFKYPGEYSLRLTKTGYLDVEDAITIVADESQNRFNYVLEKSSGTLSLTVSPSNATVKIDRRERSERRVELSPGLHELEVSAPGYKSVTESVSIERGKTQRKNISLEAITGGLQVIVQPMTARSRLVRNGSQVREWTGSERIENLPVGTYTITSTLSGYEETTKPVQVSKGELKEVRITLEQEAVREPETAPQISTGGKDYTSAKGIEMVYVEGGTFTMGCTDEQGGDCGSDERPTHSVTLSSFYIGKYEVTQGEYETLMGTNPSNFSGANNPVEKVTWYDVVEYCNALSLAEGLEPCYTINGSSTTCDFTKNGYRLPTEAEWEYAARGGSESQGYKYSGSDNIAEVAWYGDNPSSRTHEVGTKSPNELGIYDMSGNVWEWCWDWYGSYSSSSVTNPTGPESGSYRVRRGGGWVNDARDCRVAYRRWSVPTGDADYLGFRLARTE